MLAIINNTLTGTVIIPILLMSKWRHRERRQLIPSFWALGSIARLHPYSIPLLGLRAGRRGEGCVWGRAAPFREPLLTQPSL